MRFCFGLLLSSLLLSTPTEAFSTKHPSLVACRSLRDPMTTLGAAVSRDAASSASGGMRHSDWARISLHAGLCCLLSQSLCWYEDFDCANLKPNVSNLRPHAIHGMGFSLQDRLRLDSSTNSIPSYNEIMALHRTQRVQSWKQPPSSAASATAAIHRALDTIPQAQQLAQNYNWEQLQQLLRQPVFQQDLEQACTQLLSDPHLTDEARQEIGFVWGSCAWRHCGAQADAQEALAELYNLAGVLEPFECDFCLDVIERSLRSILSVVDNPNDAWKGYTPHIAQRQEPMIPAIESTDSAVVERDFLRVLNELKNNLDD